MKRWMGLEAIPSEYAQGRPSRSVVTIGNFDGVHHGHRHVLQTLRREAESRDATSVAITFDPHPLQVVRPETAPTLIQGISERLALLDKSQIDATVVMPFDHDLATWSPDRFVHDVLYERLNTCAVVVGRDVRFGHKNSGDLTTLREMGEKYTFDVVALDDITGRVHDADEGRRWSSSWVRQLLDDGDVEGAAEVMGRLHRMTGSVVHGDHRGRELGFPTANFAPDSMGMVPADGVYAGWMMLNADAPQNLLPCAISVGTNPTFDGVERRVEAYVLDRDDLDLYGQTIAIDFVKRLRETLKFDSVDALIDQMNDDVRETRKILKD